MRMWGVNPQLMCRQHLLGEHVELHMMAGSIRAGRSLLGHTSQKQIDVTLIGSRHAELVVEMKRRGMNHHSELPAPGETMADLLQFFVEPRGSIDVEANLIELRRRCTECRRAQARFRRQQQAA